MEGKVKLSIIVPVYNVEKYILKCINSIISNKSNEFEIILINDGSLDNSGKICEEFEKKDNRIKYISKKNEGCSATRNFGIKEAKGEYIWFIDSDDFISKNAVSKILEILKEKTDIIIFAYERLENKEKKDYFPKEIKEKFEIYSQQEVFNNPVNKVYKTSIIKNNNIFFTENCHMGEDMAFNFKYFFYCKKIKVIKEILYYYVFTEGVTSNLNKRKEIFLAFDDIYNFFIKNKKFKEMKDILKKYYLKHAIFYPYNLILSSNISPKMKKEKLKELNFELNKRKYIFNTNFLYKQVYYYLKFKIDFLRPYYRKIKNRNKEK